MTAYTSAYALPYQLATDRPCDAAGVWCQLRDLVAAELATTEAILSRTYPARPCAQVSLRTAVSMPALNTAASNFPVNWDTIDFDNDNMVNFDKSTQFIRPTRTGIYNVVGWAQLGAGVFPEEVQCFTMTGASGPDLLGSSGHLSGTFEDDNLVGGSPVMYKTEGMVVWDQSALSDVRNLGFGMLFDGLTSTAVQLTAARLAVYWRRDAP